MLAVDVLREEDLRRVPDENEPSGFAQIPNSDISLSNPSNDTHNSSFNNELNLNEEIDNSLQTNYIAKMKNNKFDSHGQKPYDQLTEREKQRLMERKTRRAIRLRDEMRRYGINRSISHSGKDDLLRLNDNGVIGHRRRENSTCSVGSVDSSEELSSSFEEEDLEKDLENWYLSGCVDDYFENDKSSSELVKNYMDMEDKIEQVQKSLMEARLQQNARRRFNAEEEIEKIRVFREEIEILMRENDVLQTENAKLSIRLSTKTG